MSHKDSGWRPKGATQKYNGFEVWDHGIWPNEVNTGVVDGKISFDFGEDGAELEDEDEEGAVEGDENEEVEVGADEDAGAEQGEEVTTEVDDQGDLEGDVEAATAEDGGSEEGEADATREADAERVFDEEASAGTDTE